MVLVQSALKIRNHEEQQESGASFELTIAAYALFHDICASDEVDDDRILPASYKSLLSERNPQRINLEDDKNVGFLVNLLWQTNLTLTIRPQDIFEESTLLLCPFFHVDRNTEFSSDKCAFELNVRSLNKK